MEKTDQSSIAVALCYLLAKQWYCGLDEYIIFRFSVCAYPASFWKNMVLTTCHRSHLYNTGDLSVLCFWWEWHKEEERIFEQADILTNMVILRLTQYLRPECGWMHLQPLESRACWLPWSRAWLSSVWAGRKLPSLPWGRAEAEDVQKVGSEENMQLQDGSLKMRMKATVLTFWPQLKSLYFELWILCHFGCAVCLV